MRSFISFGLVVAALAFGAGCDDNASAPADDAASGGGATTSTGPKCGETRCAEDEFCAGACARPVSDTVPVVLTCQKRPTSCAAGGESVCACDGNVYASECDAHRAGTDVGDLGPMCAAPQGMFACGSTFCRLADQFCNEHVPIADGPLSETCEPLPACHGAPCSCVPPDAAEDCATTECDDSDGTVFTCNWI